VTLKKSLSEKKLLEKSQDDIDKLNEIITDESIIEIDNDDDDDDDDMINELNTTLWKDTKLSNPTWEYDKNNCITNETVIASGLREVQWVFDNTDIIIETPEGENGEGSAQSENIPNTLNKSSSHKLFKAHTTQNHTLPLEKNNNKANIDINQSNSNNIQEKKLKVIDIFDETIGQEIQVHNILNPRGGLERYPLIGKIIPIEIKIKNKNDLILEKENIIKFKKELEKIKKKEKYISSLKLTGRNLKPSEMFFSDDDDSDDDDDNNHDSGDDTNNSNQEEDDEEDVDEDAINNQEDFVTVQLKYYQISCKVLNKNIIDEIQEKKKKNLNIVPIELEALFLLIEKYNVNSNCIWKILDGVDFHSQIYPGNIEDYFLSRSSFFHQIRNLVWEFDNMNELKDENNCITHPRLHCSIDLQLCYSEDILDWVFAKFGDKDGILIDVNALSELICKEMPNCAIIDSSQSFNIELSMESQDKKQFIYTSNDTINSLPIKLIKAIKQNPDNVSHTNNLEQVIDIMLPTYQDQQEHIQCEDNEICQLKNNNLVAETKFINNEQNVDEVNIKHSHLQPHEIGFKIDNSHNEISKFEPLPPNVKPPPPKNNNGRNSPNIWKPLEKQSSFNSISDINIQEQHIRVSEIENKLTKLLSSENLNNLIDDASNAIEKIEEKENHDKEILKKTLQTWGK
jgi:hypothetical protein